jgi:signal transduction histidine kinase
MLLVSSSPLAATFPTGVSGIGGAHPAQGSGLRGLAGREETLGGHVVIDSRAGRGTRISASTPLRETPSRG